MKRQFINPPGSPATRAYHHVVTVEGGRTLYLAGQVAFDAERRIVGATLAEQLDRVLLNLRIALEAAASSPRDVVQITTYVVGYRAQQMREIADAVAAFFPAERLPAHTLVGVESLSTPGLLVEIAAVAVTDAISAHPGIPQE